ncbi:MAG: T9SS type A sorting domain-containing protein [Flavobacteriales bacterium]|nr:T9SS type A sorting domain-containing protein [Flavobacteriales bacterium]
MKQKLQILTKIAFVFLAFLGLAKGADAQCVAGEVEVFLDVTTDTWGYELYWELAPTGSACGTAAIFAGGNTAVGCAGGGGQVAAGTDPGAYPNSATTTEPQTATGFCLTIGNDYDIIMIDDWGDGGNTITSVAQSVNAVPTSGTETFTFTAVAPPVGPDAVMTTSAPEYTIYPLVQVGNIVSNGNIENIGVADATGVTMTVNVYELTGQTVVYTATSASGTVTIGANNNFTVPGFTPTTVENYFVEYIASITETDDNMVNDTTGYIIQVSDSTFARDDANINGVSGGLGIGAGAAANGKLGQMFALTVSDTLTSVDVFLRNTNSLLYGQPLVIELYDVVAGFPNTLLASSTSITLDSTENTLWNVDFSDYYMVAGEYAVVVNETDSNITIGTTTAVFTTGAGFVSWAGNNGGAWSNNEDFNFNVSYVLRPNFGVVDIVTGITEIEASAWEVYPNPATDNIIINDIISGSTIEIFNNLGQVVYTEITRSTKANINVADFTNGIYTIKVTGSDNVLSKSFVKQ